MGVDNTSGRQHGCLLRRSEKALHAQGNVGFVRNGCGTIANEVESDLSRQGKLVGKAFIEAFNSRFR